jgi:hypothetical protein
VMATLQKCLCMPLPGLLKAVDKSVIFYR